MSTLTQRLDELAIKLDIMSQIKIYERPIFKNKKVTIRKYYTLITGIIRIISGESRFDIVDGFDETYFDINKLIEDYMQTIDINNPIIIKHDIECGSDIIRQFTRLKDHVNKIYNNTEETGIIALLLTYSSDPEFTANLRNIKTKYESIHRKICIHIDNLVTKFRCDY